MLIASEEFRVLIHQETPFLCNFYITTLSQLVEVVLELLVVEIKVKVIPVSK